MSYWVVVVDDDIINLKVARSILSKVDMKVGTAKSGKDFLRFMQKNHPDLVLLDIRMPDMDGFEVYDKLREYEKQEGLAPVPVIFLTAEEDGDIEMKCLELGAADFVRKPFHDDVLIHRINRTLNQRHTMDVLRQDASIDKLTGCLNKESSIASMKTLCADEKGALIILDLDSFKLVNDMHGHDMGDKVLKAFSEIVRKNLRADDVIGRIGGDEFIVFGKNIPHEGVINNIVNRINTQLFAKAKELMGEDCHIPLGVSAGAVFVAEEDDDYDALFKKADQALYYVKKNGKHGYAVYNEETNSGQKTTGNADSLEQLSQILEERGDATSTFFLGQDAFMNVYRFMLRYIKTYQRIAHKVLFTLTPKSAEYQGTAIMEMYGEFTELLKHNLRKSDFMMQSRPNQFFVLLPELEEQHRDIVLDRIEAAWSKLGHNDVLELSYEHEIIDGSVPDTDEGHRAFEQHENHEE